MAQRRDHIVATGLARGHAMGVGWWKSQCGLNHEAKAVAVCASTLYVSFLNNGRRHALAVQGNMSALGLWSCSRHGIVPWREGASQALKSLFSATVLDDASTPPAEHSAIAHTIARG
ncbi:hypothetical protein CDD81_5316 [Ophiocordyceps australis]|uniref:Uncharacterized protein n=1 Tax=Ophiocordyceps australis TaxID=1399860 RepID=A0A2C5YJ04_9HYPO|nr:hypothetical protein CDD81_5316 [Ophiocordyceps australis]